MCVKQRGGLGFGTGHRAYFGASRLVIKCRCGCVQGKLAVYEKQMLGSPDQQISLTDPDSRSMATSASGSGVVGYNVLQQPRNPRVPRSRHTVTLPKPLTSGAK